MKRLLLLIFIVALHIASITSIKAQTHFVAFLEGSEEDATFQVPAHGYAHIILSKDRSELSYMLNVWKTTQLNPIAHFHTGARRVNGPVVKHLTLDNGVLATGVWKTSDADDPLTTALVDSLFAGRLYLNAHTQNNPGGEVRGQIFQPEAYSTFATPEDEVPDPGKDTLFGGGAGIFVRDPINNTVYYRATANGLSSAATMAHIHRGDLGVVGPPVKNTVVESNTITTSGYWTPEAAEQPLTAEHVDALQTGKLYWNIHTALHAPGELRGQIDGAEGGYFFTALLSGPSEEIGSGGEGTAVFYLTPTLDTLVTVAASAGLSGPIIDGHIHRGRPGVDGVAIVNTPRTTFGIFHNWTALDLDRPLTRADVDSLFAGAYYLNLHTQKYPNGEIRGQIIPLGQPPLPAKVELAERTGELQLSATSNPVRGLTTINYELPYPMRVELTLCDVSGKPVWYTSQSGDKGMNTCQLSVSDLVAGTYVVQLIGGGESASMNLVVTK